jgi:hypothetical protein
MVVCSLDVDIEVGGAMSQRPEFDHVGTRRVARPSPPVDFPVYGLDASWPSVRWLELFGEALGDPVDWVCLGHQNPDGASLVYVETFSRERTDVLVARSLESAMQHVASYAAALLANVTLPVDSLPRPDGFYRALIGLTEERSGKYVEWPEVRWQVDGLAATARVWRFAEGWLAVSDAAPAVYLAAVGLGTEPGGLRLAMLQDGDAYHFDMGQPMHARVMVASHAARADGDLPPPRRGDWHADQLRLMRESGRPD